MVPPQLLPSPPNNNFTNNNKMATTTAPSNNNTTTTTNTHHKKHTRHHVKRRSTGRVHVTKLAPMARANAHTDTEADDHDSNHSTHKRPHMRRSQSQRSLNRLSAGMTALAPLHPQTSAIKNNNASTISPPTTPPLQSREQQEQQEKERKQKKGQKQPLSSSSEEEEEEEEEEQAVGKENQDKVDNNDNNNKNYPIPSISSPAILRNNNNNNKNITSTSATSGNTSTSKPYVLSQRGPAAPVEQTFNAVANNLVAPDKAALPSFHKQATSPSKSPSNTSDSHAGKKRMPPLRSQFIDEHHHPSSSSSPHHHNNIQHNQHHHYQQGDSQHHSQHSNNNNIKRPGLEKTPRQSNVASAATAQPPGLSRTQQKLMLQRQHCLVDDENNLGHPRNMLRLTRELERVGREYRCVKRCRDPMLESLQRCIMGNKQEPEQQQQQRHQPHRLHGNNRTRSSSVLPSSSQFQQEFPTDAHIPHLEQRQAIHRRQHQLKMLAMTNENNNHHHNYAYNRNSSPVSSSNDQQPNTAFDMIRWSAGALLDRVWYGNNNDNNHHGGGISGSGSH